jgi:hypothetical protein
MRNWTLFLNALWHVVSMAVYITLNIWFILFFCRNGGLAPDPPSHSELTKSASLTVSREAEQPEKASE